MKIGIISFNNIYKCPYINPYTDILKKLNIDYDIIFFDRDNADVKSTHKIGISYNKKMGKIYNFFTFRQRVISILKTNKYDRIIVLTTLPAILLYPYLKKNYKNKYLIDIRDFTYENYNIFKWVEKKVIRDSALSVISSPGFLKFLPKENYILCHNINKTYCPNVYKLEKNRTKICIGYVGSIGYISQCKNLIQLVLKDSRFTFYFYGDESSKGTVFPYIDSLNNDRIKYFGRYTPEEKSEIIKKIDILFNAYGNGNPLLDTALSNKLYDSMYFKKPLLTSPNTLMNEETKEFSFSIDFNDENIMDKMYEWYINLNTDKYNEYCDKYLYNVIDEQQNFYKEICKFIRGK